MRRGLAFPLIRILAFGIAACHATPSSAPLLSPVTARSSKPKPQPACPFEMALVDSVGGQYCIDRWEASLERVTSDGRRELWPGNHPVERLEREMVARSVRGRRPQGYISGKQAEVACANAGKRLCSLEEWQRACRGPEDELYPYGNERRPGLCNDRYRTLDAHPVERLFQRDSALGCAAS